MKKFKGTGVAVVTPFKKDHSIDFNALGKVTDHLIKGGVNYIVSMGTTGESATLSEEEKHAVISYMSDYIGDRVPLVVGIGGNNTAEVVNFINSTDFSGISAILSVAPYYNKPNQRGLYEHYKMIASTSPVPVIIYNVPSRTASNISPETCVKLARDFSNIIAVKEASGDMNQILRILRDKPDDFMVISGDDSTAMMITAMGGSGVISVLANAYPAEWSEMIDHTLKGNLKSAREIHFRFMEMIPLLFEDGNPAGVKAIMTEMGLCGNYLRLPLVPVSKAFHAKITTAMTALK